MKTWIVQIAIATTAATAALTAAPEAQAASDYLLEIDGIKGESRARASITDFRWSMALAGPAFNPFQPSYAGGIGVASGDLNGDGWDSVALVVNDRLGGPPIFQYLRRSARIQPTPEPGTLAGHREWIVIESMSPPVMSYRPLLPTGGRGDPITGTWDVNGGFVGDLGVFAAFNELGAVRWPDGSLSISTPVPEPATWALWLLGAGLVAQRLRRARTQT
jgi:hypothetical protein